MRALVTVGLPGCGKTTFARALAPGFVDLNLDAMRGAIAGDPTDQAVTHRAKLLRDAHLANCAAAGREVILSDTHAKRKDRTESIRTLRALGYAVFLVVFDVGEATCRRRNAARARPVPAEAMDRMAARLRACPPEAGEADGLFVVVQGVDVMFPRPGGRGCP